MPTLPIPLPYLERIKEIDLIKELEGTIFFDKIISIWSLAEEKIHPFQKGDCYQSSRHCYNVLLNLNNLLRLGKIQITDLEKYILCCSAILHDIDKACIDYDRKVKIPQKHGYISAEFIRNNKDVFTFTQPEAEAISNVVIYHGDYNLNNVLKECEAKSIEEPIEYKQYGKVNYVALSAIFKLADMMDVTYKRLSSPIITLNYGKEITDSKILARRKFSSYEILDTSINLKTYRIENFNQYQSILIAVDMANRELAETKTKKMLSAVGLPNKFSVDIPGLEREIETVVQARNKISSFNDEYILIVKDDEEEEMVSSYKQYSELITFSEGERDQIQKKYENLFDISLSTSTEKIKNEFKEGFGYSIEKIKIFREYKEDGSIDFIIVYQNIEKLRMAPLPIRYDLQEHSAIAKLSKSNCRFVELKPKDPNEDGTISFPSEKKSIGIAPTYMGFEKIEKIALKFKSTDSWCMKRSDFKKYYPNDTDGIEDMDFVQIHPICNVEVILKFPDKYEIEPAAKYIFEGKTKLLHGKYDKAQNSYTFKNLQKNANITFTNPPKYHLYWAIPD